MEHKTLITCPVKNNLRYVQESVESILKYTHVPYKLLIIDDNTKDKFLIEYLTKLEKDGDQRIEIIHNTESFGYGWCGNEGIARLTDEAFYVLLNSDIFVTPYWLEDCIAGLASNERMAVVSPGTSWGAFQQSYMYAQENRLKWGEKEILEFSKKAKDLYYGKMFQWHHANGFCWIAKTAVIRQLGFFDEQFSPAYSEETDMNMRIRTMGGLIGHLRGVYVHHRGSQSVAIEELTNTQLNINALRMNCDQRFKIKWANPQTVQMYQPRYPLEQVKNFINQNTINTWNF